MSDERPDKEAAGDPDREDAAEAQAEGSDQVDVEEGTPKDPARRDEQAGKAADSPAPKRRSRRSAEVPAAAKRSTRAKRGAATAREDGEAPPAVRAKARYVRCAPRKARLVIDHIRGKSVDDARSILSHTPRAAAKDVLKLLESCVANAENNHELVAGELRVGQAYVDEGPTLKRYRPRALGRATQIRKRTSHMTIVLTAKE